MAEDTAYIRVVAGSIPAIPTTGGLAYSLAEYASGYKKKRTTNRL